MLDLFTQLTLIIVLASVLGIIARRLKQPTILAYLVAGMAVGIFGFFELSENAEIFEVFSDLGIMFLLFLVGLEVNYMGLRRIGKEAIALGLGQVLFTFLFGYLIGVFLFGYEPLVASYIALALTFSSTIIVVNLLSEKKDLNNLYGRISVGMLLVQDLIVILVLVLLAGLGAGTGVLNDTLLGGLIINLSPALKISVGVLGTLVQAILIFVLAFWLSKNIIPNLFNSIARSTELIFLTSLAWLFFLTATIDGMGFSKEIGGFLAGLTLANSFENLQIAQRLKPLKDFFVLVFFVILGTSIIVVSDIGGTVVPVVTYSLFVLIGNPLIVLVLMGLFGFKRRISFFTGLTVAQISEFSLILVALGVKLGHLENKIVALVTLIAVITITISTYVFMNGDKLFSILSPHLRLFERSKTNDKDIPQVIYRKPIVLIGFHRTGKSIALNLPRDQLLVIDYDPEIEEKIKEYGVDHIFGDMVDEEVTNKIDFKSVRLVVSTGPDYEHNVVFLEFLRNLRRQKSYGFKIIMRARTDHEARSLYKKGADYVLLPHFTAGRHLAKTIATDPYLQTLPHLKRKDLLEIEEDVYTS